MGKGVGWGGLLEFFRVGGRMLGVACPHLPCEISEARFC